MLFVLTLTSYGPNCIEQLYAMSTYIVKINKLMQSCAYMMLSMHVSYNIVIVMFHPTIVNIEWTLSYPNPNVSQAMIKVLRQVNYSDN